MVRFFSAKSGKTTEEFLSLPYSDISFLYQMIQEEKAEEYNNQLEYSAFGAFLQVAPKGLTKEKTFPSYKKKIGLVDPKSLKVAKTEKEEAVKVALSIYQRLQRAQNEQKNI